MVILFYISGVVAVITTACVICIKNPVYSLLYLIISLLSIACNLFSLRASFSGAIEVIIYAGAIMVLFLFSVMMLDTKNYLFSCQKKKDNFLSKRFIFGVLLMVNGFLLILLFSIFKLNNSFIDLTISKIPIKQIGITLFGPYILIVEIASLLLLSALISVLHIAQENKIVINRILTYNEKKD